MSPDSHMTPCSLRKKYNNLLNQILIFVVSNLLSYIFFRKEVKVFNKCFLIVNYQKIASKIPVRPMKKLRCKCSIINLTMHRIILLMNAGSSNLLKIKYFMQTQVLLKYRFIQHLKCKAYCLEHSVLQTFDYNKSEYVL